MTCRSVSNYARERMRLACSKRESILGIVGSGQSRHDVGSTRYFGWPVENAVPNEQVLRRARTGSHGPGAEDHTGGVQGRTGRAQGSRGAGATLHLLADRMQRPLRGPRGDLAG